MELIEISDRVVKTSINAGLYEGVNISAIILNDCIVVIDTSKSPSTAKEFRKIIELKYKLPVKYLILTHYHQDHTSGMDKFKDCTIIGGKNLQTYILHDQYPLLSKEEQNSQKIKVDIIVSTKYCLKIDDFVFIIQYCGGHTNDSIFINFTNEKILFSGDLLFENRTPYGSDFSCNPDLWLNTLHNFKKEKYNLIIPGHGKTLSIKDLKNHINYYQNFKNIIQKSIKKKIPIKEIDIDSLYNLEEQKYFNTNLKMIQFWCNFYSNS